MNKAINRVVSVFLAGATFLMVTSYGFFGTEPTEAVETTTTTTTTTMNTAIVLETTGSIPVETENNSVNLLSKKQVLGELTGVQYHNDYFGFDLTLPELWHVADEADYNFLMKDALKEIFDNLAKSEQIDLDNMAMLPMLYVLKHPADFKEGPNPSLMINGESLKGQQGMITTSEGYLSMKRARLNQTNAYEYSDITPVVVGGVPFSLMTMTTEVNGITVNQSVYAAIKNEYVLDIVLTFFTDEEKKELEMMLETLQFD